MSWHTLVVPGRDYAIADTVPHLNALFPGSTPLDGVRGIVRAGAWPDTDYVDLTYDATAAGGPKWVSKPRMLIAQSDQGYMGVNSLGYTYIGTDNAGAAAGQVGWTTRAIKKPNAFLAAGLKLQVKFSGIIAGSIVPAVFSVMPFFFQNDDNETVIGSSDGSSAIGWLTTPMVSPNTNAFTIRALAWQDIMKNTQSTPLVATDVVKANLWPRLYGKVASGAAFGSLIDADLLYRWVSV